MAITGVPPSSVDPVAQVVAALEAATAALAAAALTLADRGAWLTATSYAVGDVSTQGGQRYCCRTAHTSGTFATDLAASKWVSLDAVAALAASSNLSDIASASTARTNLGLGTAATISSTAGGDLSGTLPSPTVAKVNGIAVTGTPQSGYLLTATGSSAATWQAASGASLTETVNTVASSGAAVTIPATTTATINRVTLTAACTFTFPTATAGTSFTLILTQDGTGSRTVTWPAAVKWPSGVAATLSTSAGKTDWLTFTCADGSTWAGFLAGSDVR